MQNFLQLIFEEDRVKFWNFYIRGDRMPGLMSAHPNAANLEAFRASKYVQLLRRIATGLDQPGIMRDLEGKMTSCELSDP